MGKKLAARKKITLDFFSWFFIYYFVFSFFFLFVSLMKDHTWSIITWKWDRAFFQIFYTQRDVILYLCQTIISICEAHKPETESDYIKDNFKFTTFPFDTE